MNLPTRLKNSLVIINVKREHTSALIWKAALINSTHTKNYLSIGI